MKNTYVIAKFTFIEVYRSKIMIGLLILAMSLLLVTYIASEFAYGAPAKIALDFSVGIMSFSNLMVSIFLGATLISKEIESKTLYMILSRPLSRNSFLIGKVLGLSSVLVFNTLFLTLVGFLVFTFLGGSTDSLFITTALFSLLEAIIIMCFGVLFSLITNVVLSVIFTLMVLIAGHSFNESMSNFFAKTNPFFSSILKFTSFILPDLERFNLKDFLIYRQNLDPNFISFNFVYGVVYLLIMLILISFVFKNKNLD